MTTAKDVKTFWDVEVPVCEVDLSEKKKIVIKRVAKNDKDYVDVRNTFQDKEGKWKFGKGIAIPLEHAEDIADIIKGAVKEEVLPF
jgi:hypothetical protein